MRRCGRWGLFQVGWVVRENLSEEVTWMEIQMSEEGSREATWGKLVLAQGSLAPSFLGALKKTCVLFKSFTAEDGLLKPPKKTCTINCIT